MHDGQRSFASARTQPQLNVNIYVNKIIHILTHFYTYVAFMEVHLSNLVFTAKPERPPSGTSKFLKTE